MQIIELKQRVSSRLPVTPQSSKFNLSASWLSTRPQQLASLGVCSPHSHFKALWSQNVTAQYLLSPHVELLCFRAETSLLNNNSNSQHRLLIQTLRGKRWLCFDDQK